MVTRSLAASLRLLDPAGRFDRPAIMRTAWAMARAVVAPGRPVRGYTPPPPPTLRDAFAENAFLASFTDNRPLVAFHGAVVAAAR